MSKATINGRRAVSTKTASASMLTEDVFGNQLAISEELRKELAEQGLIGRWVNAAEMHKNQGYHKRGWKVYKRKEGVTINTSEALFGQDPERVVRRGDCLLAVKTIEEVERHRNWLEDKANRSRRFSKEKAKELRELAHNAGIKTRVDEGYGEEDDSD